MSVSRRVALRTSLSRIFSRAPGATPSAPAVGRPALSDSQYCEAESWETGRQTRLGFFLTGRHGQPGIKTALFVTILAGLCVVTYLPALDNGFISDDYIMLDWVEQWRADVSYLFKLAPDVFRLTSYAVLRFFTWAFGYNAVILYAFLILVHFANCMLLFRLSRLLGGDFRKAAMAAVLFAVIQKAQEAIMWLAAMAYALGGFCVLAALVLWRKGHHWISSIFFLAGLFSTDSVLALLLLVPLADAWVSWRLRWRRQYLILLAPPLVFTIIFFATLPSNQMVQERLYAIGWHALIVFGKSVFRLAFPTLLAAIALLSLMEHRLLLREISRGVAWMCITLLPFIFVTYQSHVPSRHNYVPVMGLALALAKLFVASRSRQLVGAMIALVAVANISYIWIRKDSQFELRARPTTLLLEELRSRAPERILVADFPLNPWIAKMSARHVDGWEPWMIEIDSAADSCATCPRLQWNKRDERYDVILPGDGRDTVPGRRLR